ncbi:hypothetical protein [Amycolatopsis thailandensis]|uniref:hypothetical protein n=1 Tax=Amycolatopsis thailandensis TaxID=589330 RepID=UPI0011773873|nr:hypothetical protein [Amycolatopsis thailandensis]
MQESWARVSLRVSLDVLSLGDVEGILGRSTDLDAKGRPGVNWWKVDFYGEGYESLDSQLDLLAETIQMYRSGLIDLGRRAIDINVLIGWEPRRGQDSVGFDANLIAGLAEIGGRIILDTVTDDCEHVCE